MRFFEIVVSGAALISSAFAVTIDTYPTSVEAGKSYTITYSPKDAPATFILRKGAPGNLDTIGEVGTGTGGSFTWQVSSTLANGANYALQVKQGSEENYTGLFGLTGGSNAVSSAASSASAAASSASAAVSSIRASASSVVASITSAAASASASASSGMNSTVASATLSKTPSASKPASTTGGSPPESTGAASMLSASPLAIVLGAVAAFAYLN